eukprot:GFYU01006576.1.p1 GENE.GFYU01006576.1~~GFYU01006576.1.p1  ORF type:complete len:403 (-),score=143.43 GFYU01006576.1:326-1534(-)
MKLATALLFAVVAVQLVSTLAIEPDATRSIRGLIVSKGYPYEEHHVKTADGYILLMHRIPHGIAGNATAAARQPVLLQHGILDSSDTWVLNSADESLAFIMADAGYDVWMGNSRGNKYSQGHVNLDVHGKQFWKFSWDEMAKFDIPAVVDYVLGVAGFQELSVVGHSQGCTQMFAALVTNHKLAQKVKLFVALAPVLYMEHATSLPLNAAATTHLDQIVGWLGIKEFLPDTKILRWLLPNVCATTPKLCDSVIYLMCGLNLPGLNQTRLDVYTAHFPAGTSVQDLQHYAQLLRGGGFKAYDWGSAKLNDEHYGQKTAPHYNLADFPTDTKLAVYYGGKDDIADKKDVARLVTEVPDEVLVASQMYEPYAHLDFTWGETVHIDIYPDVVELVKKVHPVHSMEE